MEHWQYRHFKTHCGIEQWRMAFVTFSLNANGGLTISRWCGFAAGRFQLYYQDLFFGGDAVRREALGRNPLIENREKPATYCQERRRHR